MEDFGASEDKCDPIVLEIEDVELVIGDEVQRTLTNVVQKVFLLPKLLDISQRHTLFKTKCIVHQKVYDVIIDNGST